MVFRENLKSKSIVTFRTEPFSAGVMCFGAREPSGSGTLFSFNTALGRKYKFTPWKTYTGIGSIFKERTWGRITYTRRGRRNDNL